MKIAVVTPYCKEHGNIIARCVESVAKQTVACRHYLIADLPAAVFNDHREHVYRHISTGESHCDYGNTPRSIGALLAISEGADVICFLDADNTFDPDHIETCLALANPDLDYIVALRRITLPDGTPVNCQDESIEKHVDTNCFFFLPGSFHTLAQWALQPRQLAIVDDRLFLMCLNGLKSVATDRPTVTYVSNWRIHWEKAGLTPPPDAKTFVNGRALTEWWRGLSDRERVIYRRRLNLPNFNL